MATPFVLDFKIDGESQVLSALSRFGEYADDLREPFAKMADDFVRIEGERFDAEGPGWAPLSPRYARWKEANYPGRPILVREGHLRESLTGGAGFVREITKDSMVLGSSVKYALYHHRGGSRLPMREVVRLSAEDRTRWAKILQAYLVSKARAAGLDANAGAA